MSTWISEQHAPEHRRLVVWESTRSRFGSSRLRPQQRRLYVRTRRASLQDRRFEAGRYLRQLAQQCASSVAVSLFSSDAQTQATALAIADASGKIRIHDQRTHQVVRTLDCHKSAVGSLSLNHAVLSSGGASGRIFETDLRAPAQHTRLVVGHKGSVSALEWQRLDGNYLASGGTDERLLVWDARSSKPLVKFPKQKAIVKALVWSPHQRGIILSAGGAKARQLRIWDTSKSNVLSEPLASVDTGSSVRSRSSQSLRAAVLTLSHFRSDTGAAMVDQLATVGHSSRSEHRWHSFPLSSDLSVRSSSTNLPSILLADEIPIAPPASLLSRKLPSSSATPLQSYSSAWILRCAPRSLSAPTKADPRSHRRENSSFPDPTPRRFACGELSLAQQGRPGGRRVPSTKLLRFASDFAFSTFCSHPHCHLLALSALCRLFLELHYAQIERALLPSKRIAKVVSMARELYLHMGLKATASPRKVEMSVLIHLPPNVHALTEVFILWHRPRSSLYPAVQVKTRHFPWSQVTPWAPLIAVQSSPCPFEAVVKKRTVSSVRKRAGRERNALHPPHDSSSLIVSKHSQLPSRGKLQRVSSVPSRKAEREREERTWGKPSPHQDTRASDPVPPRANP